MVGAFPGMDPWLEHPARWPDVHNSLIAALGARLGPMLRPRYFVGIEERTYPADAEGLVFVGRPDLAVERADRATPRAAERAPQPHPDVVTVTVPMLETVRETWLEIRAVPNGRVVTVVELLSPSNKAAGDGRDLYEQKRRRVLGTRTHLVELDLLRGGERMPLYGDVHEGDYRILVSRSERRPSADLLVFSVRDAIPRFPLPLAPGEPEPEVDLGAVLAELYEQRGYDLVLDYRAESIPPLAAADTAWADGLLRARGIRR
jgi:hypothetical protein